MKTINKLFTLSALSLLLASMTACNDDDKNLTIEVPEIQKEIVLSEPSARVKIGEENKLILNVVSGNDDYHAFSLNEEIVTVAIENGKIVLQGLKNGSTEIVITDKYNTVCKCPVQVYTTDVLEVENTELSLTTLLGYEGSVKTAVLQGNGDYTISSDNPAIRATINAEGSITISSTSKNEAITGVVTVKDCSDLSAEINVEVTSRLTPIYTEDEIEIFTANNKVRYFMNGSDTFASYYTSIYSVDAENNYTYGWKYYTYYSFYIWFNGDNTVGKKENATFRKKDSYNDTGVVDIDFEIVKNDGEYIWGIYSFIKDEKMNFGYICSKIAQ